MNIRQVILDKSILRLDIPRNALIVYAIIKNCNDYDLKISKQELLKACESLCEMNYKSVVKGLNYLLHENYIEEEELSMLETNKGVRVITRYTAKAPTINIKDEDEEVVPVTREEETPWYKPTYDEVFAYANERQCTSLAEVFFKYYEGTGWKNKNGRRIRNWKQTFLTWERRNNEKEQFHVRKILE